MTITGALFSEEISGNKVRIGPADCTVTAASATQLNCTLQQGTG